MRINIGIGIEVQVMRVGKSGVGRRQVDFSTVSLDLIGVNFFE